MQQCTIIEAREIFSQIENLGLECCEKVGTFESSYDLLEFAYLRKYVFVNDTFVANVHTLQMLYLHIEEEKIELSNKYTKEYGSKEKWTYETFEKYNEDKDKEIEKHAKTIRKLRIESLVNLSNHKQVEEYTKYINVFFGKKAKYDTVISKI